MLHNHQTHEHATGTLLGKLNAEHHAPAANLRNNAGEFSSNFLQACLQIRPSLPAAAQNILFLDGLDSGYASGAGQLVATKGGGMQKRRFNEALPSSCVAHNGTNWHHAAAQSLGAGHQIRLHAFSVDAKPVAGATDAGLHLVRDEQCSLGLANFLCSGKIACGRHNDAALALDGLQDYRSSVLVHCCSQSISITIFHMGKALQKGLKGVAI